MRRCRELRVTPHVAKNEHARRSSAIDARTTRHAGYSMSTKARMLSEKTFGWLKTYGGLRRTRLTRIYVSQSSPNCQTDEVDIGEVRLKG